MNWKYFFTKNNLERGRYLDNNNLVTDLTRESDDLYTATVHDGTKHSVQIEKKQNSTLHISCDCEISKRQNCPHIAAVLFCIESQFPELTNSSIMGIVRKIKSHDTGTRETVVKKIPTSSAKEILQNPFPLFSKPTFFDFRIIKNTFEFSESNILQAFKMINCMNIVLNKCEPVYIDSDESMVLRCTATWKDENNSYGTVNLIFNNKCVFYFQCKSNKHYPSEFLCRISDYDDNSFYKKKKPNQLCVHKTALAILAYKYIEENNPGDLTDNTGNKVLMTIRSLLPVENNNPTYPSDIEQKEKLTFNVFPILTVTNKEFRLCFKAGYDKLYPIDDICYFFECYKTHSVFLINQVVSVNFSSLNITQQAEHSIEFLDGIYNYEIEKDEINLNEDIDYFFQYFKTTGVYDKDINKIEFTNSRLYFDSNIREIKSNDGTSSFEINIDIPDIIETNKYYYSYLHDRKKIIRILPIDMGILKPVITDIAKNKKFIIGKNQIGDFSYKIIPVLQSYGNVTLPKDNDVINSSCLNKPKFIFYLDFDKETVFCKSTVEYGSSQFALLPEGMTDMENNRDKYYERNVSSLLDDIFDTRQTNIWSTSDTDKIYYLISDKIKTLMSVGTVNVSNTFEKLKVKKASRILTAVSINENMLDLEIATDDMTIEDFINLLSSYKSRKTYHKLRNGNFISLQGANLDDWSVFINALQLKKKDILKNKIKIPLYRAVYFDSLLEEQNSLQINRSKSFIDFYTKFLERSNTDIALPDSLNNTLRQYQKDGYEWLNTLYKYGFGGILADEMGLGKTVQILSLVLHLKETNNKGTTLVVCPASLVYNWEAEIKKFTPTLSVCVITGKQSEREIIIKNCINYDIAITSYDLLKRDIVFYSDISFLIHIIDEAQYIKNNTTEVSKCVKLISSNIRFALTGTPIENRLSELWSIFDFLMPSFLFSKDKFNRDFETPIMKLSDTTISDKLKKLTSPFILRRLKSDVLKDLPEKLEETITIRLNDEQRRIYDANVMLLKNVIKDKDARIIGKEKIQILSQLTKLRQICCDPNLLFDNYEGSSSKLDACIDLIERVSDSGHRMLLFSQFTSMLSIIQKELDNKGIRYNIITGSTSKENRITLVNSFNKDCGIPVFLISLKAGGTGLNLTGADIVIHYDPWWNTAVQDQATDRAHRIGQKRVVTVYNLIASGTIEEKIIQMQKTKTKIAESILSNKNTGFSQLTREELLEILS